METVRLCFDVGGTYIKYGVFDLKGQWLDRGKVPTPNETVDAFFTALVTKINEIEQKKTIAEIGLSFPGFIDTTSGVAIMAGALTPLHGCNVLQELQQRLSIHYPVWIENDANCAALAELDSGNAKELKDFVLLTLGTGIGGALIQDRKIIHGARYRAGEFGMMITDFQTSSFKTLHDLASTRGLIDAYRQKKYLLPEQQILGEQIMQEWSEPETQRIITDWADYVALAVYNLAVTMNPEKILIGGGISTEPRLIPLILKALRKNPYWADFSVPVETCFYQNDSGLLGARYLIEQGGKA
ncbi:ROK family protein [Enterococcus gallinarum]|uniref:ROK family protein n=1 Tax=Enterococcus gallinarum TaxID=1353 RepID=UPI0012E15AA0|nr:ROK family protein [Enterococcus gallinarum]MEB6062316.1 ROK family protein [Enterococcus gallinarum]MUN91132.1 ROK family protein [Enterococcus gallinarum]